MANILVIDEDPLYSDVTVHILKKGGYEPSHVHNFQQLLDMLARRKYHLAIVDVNSLQLDPKVDIIDFLRIRHQIPVIMTTEEHIDEHFSLITDKLITLALNKPVKSTELLKVLDRLLNPNPDTWFGLENYLTNMKQLKRIDITKSNQLRPSIDTILKHIDEWGFKFEMQFEMDLVWQELLTNAVYHSHGYGDQKKQRIAIQLPDPYKVVVRFGANEKQFGISVRDYRGTLRPKMILENMLAAIEQQNLLERAAETGEDISELITDRGRGLDLIRRMTGEYYFIIDPGKSTEIIIIYDGYFEKDDSYSSLKIFELPVSAGEAAAS